MSRFSLSTALSMLDVPLPEDDDMSNDEFDGYLDDDSDAQGCENEDGRACPDSSGNSDVSQPIPDFQQPIGCANNMTNATPLQFFQTMVTNEMLDKVVEQTTLYAQQYVERNELPRHSRVHGWSCTTFDTPELKKFLATTITIGLVNYPEIEDYWSTSWPFSTMHSLRYKPIPPLTYAFSLSYYIHQIIIKS